MGPRRQPRPQARLPSSWKPLALRCFDPGPRSSAPAARAPDEQRAVGAPEEQARDRQRERRGNRWRDREQVGSQRDRDAGEHHGRGQDDAAASGSASIVTWSPSSETTGRHQSLRNSRSRRSSESIGRGASGRGRPSRSMLDVAADGVEPQLDQLDVVGRRTVAGLELGLRVAADRAHVQPDGRAATDADDDVAGDGVRRHRSPVATVSSRWSPETVCVSTGPSASRTTRSPETRFALSVPLVRPIATSPLAVLTAVLPSAAPARCRRSRS